MDKQNTLIDFERTRAGYILFNGQYTLPTEPEVIIPPQDSNSFFDVGEGQVQLFTVREDPTNYRFDLYLKGIIHSGIGSFSINGDITSTAQPYRNFFIRKDSHLIIDSNLTISKGRAIIEGIIELGDMSSLIASNGAEVEFTDSSKLIIPENGFVFSNTEALIKIYGAIEVHYSKIDLLLKNSNIQIDSQAYVHVTGLENLEKEYSLVNLLNDINLETINPNTVKEKNFNNKRILYKWVSGSPLNNSAIVNVEITNGIVALGDFKLPVLGVPNSIRDNLKVISDLKVNYGSKLIVSENVNGFSYFYPSLYIGTFIENSNRSGELLIDGELLVDGENSELILDRNGKLIISETGKVIFSNGSKFKSTSNSKIVLEIAGILQIDSLTQLNGFTASQIKFIDQGKIIILNNTENDGPELFSVPNGINKTDLFKLFKNQLSHIEFHIPAGKGIRVDQNFDSFYQEMKYWYGPYRLEKAVKEKYLVWEDDAYIEFRKEDIPWIGLNSNLYHLTKIFISEGDSDKDKLQSIIDHFKFAGFGDIVFKFSELDSTKEIRVSLKAPEVTSVYWDSETSNLIIQVTKIGNLYFANNLSLATPDFALKRTSKETSLVEGKNYIEI